MKGQVVLLDLWDVVKSKRLPPDFQTWAQSFGIYMAAVSQVYPGRIPEMMAYQMKIARYSLKYQWPSWVVYDMNFRQKKALTPGLSWAITDGDLYSECFTGMRRDCTLAWRQICHSLDHASTVCLRVPPTPKIRKSEPSQGNPTKPPPICINYNTKGCTFKKCFRLDICSNYRGKHPAKSCTTTTTTVVPDGAVRS